MFAQDDLVAALVTDRARRYQETAAGMRLRPQVGRVRIAFASAFRRLADRLDAPPSGLAARNLEACVPASLQARPSR